MAKPFRIIYCIVLLCSHYHTATSMDPVTIAFTVGGIASAVFTVGKILVDTIVYYDRKWSDPADRGEFVQRPIELSESNIMDQLRHLAKPNHIMIDMENIKNDIIFEIEKTTPGLVELNRRLTDIFAKSAEVDIKYNKFVDYYNESLHNSTDDQRYNKELLVTFAEDAINDKECSLQQNLNDIHALLTMNEVSQPGTLNLVITHIELIIEYANVKQSPQQFIYNILTSILYTQIKGYIALTFSFRILTKYNNGNYEQHLLDLDQDFSRKLNETISIFKAAMAHAPREIWKNNPLQHEEDKTFIELKHVFNLFFNNAYDLIMDSECIACNYYHAIASNDNYIKDRKCYYDLCKKQRECYGFIHDCKQQFDTKMTFCLEDESGKRYRSLVVEPDRRYGSNRSCNRPITADKDFYMRHFSYCYPCMCVCDELYNTKESIRHFNLQPSISRFSENYVMTGIRFVNHGTTIYLQIQEGQLLPNGRINESTIAWVPLNTSNTNTFTLDWIRRRQVVLDDLEVPKDNVLVGVGLWVNKWQNEWYYQDLRFKVMYAPINFTSGSVLPSTKYTELKSRNVTYTNTKVDVKGTNIPTGTSTQKVVRSKLGQKLEFEITGLVYDVGQTTIPFIDIQPVVADPPAPLAGAGIYHKAVPGTGGFIAPKLITYDVEPHLQADIADDKDISSLKDTVESENVDEKILNH